MILSFREGLDTVLRPFLVPAETHACKATGRCRATTAESDQKRGTHKIGDLAVIIESVRGVQSWPI